MSERTRTRDLLLEYDYHIIPPRPRAGGLGSIYMWGSSVLPNDTKDLLPETPIQKDIQMIYPWENISLTIFSKQLYKVALLNGYAGTEKEFLTHFVNFVSEKEIIFDTYNNFPQFGNSNMLYFDLNEKILYYWNQEYIPVNAMLIADTTINGGEA